MTQQTRQQWLEERRKTVGGSDVAGILGISKYSTPYTVWADKLCLLPLQETTEAMRQGSELEEYVAQRFTESTGLSVRRKRRMLHNPDYPYAHANIDRHITGENIGLECKTCSPFRQGEFGDYEYPPEYLSQCLHYLAVTGWDTWYLAVLIFGTSFNVYKIERKDYQTEIDTIKSEVKRFWESYVIPGIAPPMDGEPATTNALNSIFSTATDGSIDLSYMEQSFIELAVLKEQSEALEHNKELFKQQIKQAMGANIRAECSAWVANWKPNKNGTRVFTIKQKVVA